MLDGTVVNLALPRIADDLDASFAGLQWILNGYTLALAALILVGGGLGDRFGRRRMFVAGAVAFTRGVRAVRGRRERADARRRPGRPGRRRGACSRRAAWRSSRRRSPRRTAAGRSARGPGSAAWRRRSGRSSAAGSSTPRRGAGSSCSTCRSARPSSRSPCATCPSRATRTPTGRVDVPGAVLGALALAGLTLGLTQESWCARRRRRSSASSRSCSSSAGPAARSCRWGCSRRPRSAARTP